jgi:hypothetical protein
VNPGKATVWWMCLLTSHGLNDSSSLICGRAMSYCSSTDAAYLAALPIWRWISGWSCWTSTLFWEWRDP